MQSNRGQRPLVRFDLVAVCLGSDPFFQNVQHRFLTSVKIKFLYYVFDQGDVHNATLGNIKVNLILILLSSRVNFCVFVSCCYTRTKESGTETIC